MPKSHMASAISNFCKSSRQYPAKLFYKFIVFFRKLFGAKQIVIAAFPKSGSTYICGKICALNGFSSVRLIASAGLLDEQDFDLSRVRYILLTRSFPWARSFASQQHLRCNEHAIRIINANNFKVVVLVRDLMDVAVSISDHLDKESTVNPICFLDSQLLSRIDSSPISRLHFIVLNMLPWYISFYLSWKHNSAALSTNSRPLWIRYESFFSNPRASFEWLLEELGIIASTVSINRVISRDTPDRFNKGVSGRGRVAFSGDTEARKALQDLINSYPGEDFSEIYTPL